MKKKSKGLSKIGLKILSKLPQSLRGKMIRHLIELPLEIPQNLVFKVADSREELEQSFHLVYRAYLKLGYVKPNKFEMRATAHHALASTSTLIAKDGDRVIGTLTLVRDSPLKLPLENTFDVQILRSKARRLAEITSLVIDPDYRQRAGGQILFPLLKLMYEYTSNYFGADQLVIAISPKEIDFYKHLLLFAEIPDIKVCNYYGAPATVVTLNLHTALKRYQKIFSSMSGIKNLFDFFVVRKFENIQMPKRSFYKVNDPIVDFNYYQEFFVKKLGIEIAEVGSYIQPSKVDNGFRLEVQTHAFFVFGENLKQYAAIKDVSYFGLRAYIETDIEIGAIFNFEVEAGPSLKAKIQVVSVWKNVNHGVGFQIIQSDQVWKEFIHHTEKEALKGVKIRSKINFRNTDFNQDSQ
jgi:hypothetical protein